MRPQVSLQYAVLPAFVCDDQSKLCASNVTRQGHELLSRRELVEVRASQVVRSLCYWKRLVYQVLGNALQSVRAV